MSFEAIANIAAAEDKAKAMIAEAEAKAKQMILEAENEGKAAVEAACFKADDEVAELRKRTDKKAAEDAEEIASGSENKKAAMRAKAESRLEKAAALVVERIVNS